MKVIYIIQDNPALVEEIAAAFFEDKHILMEHFTWPWQLIDKLAQTGKNFSTDSAVVITNLYSARYWELSPKKPCYQETKPTHSSSPDVPDLMKEIALDWICNYLKEIVEKYKLKVIVHSFMFQFLEEQTGSPSESMELEKALEDIGVSKDDIIWRKRGDVKEEIEEIKIKAIKTFGE